MKNSTNLLALFLISLFIFVLSCTETRYEQLKSKTNYGVLPDWFGKVEPNTGGICASDGCKDSEHPLASGFCATGVDFVAIVGVDEVIPLKALEEKNSEYHKRIYLVC